MDGDEYDIGRMLNAYIDMFDKLPVDVLKIAKMALAVSETKRIPALVSYKAAAMSVSMPQQQQQQQQHQPNFVPACNNPEHECRVYSQPGGALLLLTRLVVRNVENADALQDAAGANALIVHSKKFSLAQLLFDTHDEAADAQQRIEGAGYRAEFVNAAREPLLCPKTQRFYWHVCADVKCDCRHYIAHHEVDNKRPVINQTRINLTNLPKGNKWTWEKIRDDIMTAASVDEAKTTHVRRNKQFAYIALFTHADAVVAQQNLLRCDYNASFAPAHQKNTK